MHSETPDDAEILKTASALGMLGGGRDVAHRLLAELCHGGLGLREVTSLIERDPGLTARVLKVSNSSFYGRPREVDTIARAVAVLGLDAVRAIAAAACLDRILPAGPVSPLPDIAQLVRHSLASALAAEQLARVRLPSLGADAFIGGLLHDLGAVVQARLDPLGFRRMIETLRHDPSQDLLEVEQRCLSVSQERCAQVVFGHWQLPGALVEAVCHHHRPADALPEHGSLTALVHLANYTSVLAGQSFCAELVPGPRDAGAMSEVGIGATDLDAIAADLGERVEQFLSRLR